jgi:NDP-sugar pyrophosphorylase family protein
MKAMILAAGLGSRLGPITFDRPKALVEINGTPLLELVLQRLESCGVHDITINAHHHAPQILAFVEKRRRETGITIHVSIEPTLLDTGGAIVAARRWLDNPGPILVHNVDVLSTIPLAQLIADHEKSQALATLAVKERPSRRQLLFDAQGNLVGARGPDGDRWVAKEPPLFADPLAFSGVHVISPGFFDACPRSGRFGIVDAYLDLVRDGYPVKAWRADAFAWKDAGRPEALTPL